MTKQGITAKPLHLCMVALTAYPVLAGRSDYRLVGGAQVQQVMIARALVEAGVRVSLICLDFGQPAIEVIDGIEVHRCFAPGAGVPGLRFFHPRMSGLFAAMKRINADVYYQRCSGMTTGLVAAWARMAGKPSIYAGASDLDFQPGPPNLTGAKDRFAFNRGLAAVSAVVLQNPRQQELLRQHHGREGVLIPSCYNPGKKGGELATSPGQHGEVLWVGMIRPVKRPDRFLQLARALPHLRFRMIGGALGETGAVNEYFERIKAEADDLPNVSFMGFVPFADADQFFDQAALLVNTSDHEGFPNTFLQAWARGVPCVAMFDTGSRLNGSPPYALVADDAALLAKIMELMSDASIYANFSDRAFLYFKQEHSPEQAAARYIQLLLSLCDKTAGAVAAST
ncbi:glycosyltransferase family 4 protein [Roseateles albus]|uniref:Glycosyltransferase family 4 protein n=1 Tax=Roseateles albus TaxID=2987525 RepID=A0ABT5KF59_9BURK|nr:glycosyltransferase family 4 protein [Roseateles albus]MDC8772079.1 glycosyltransferase family 4 protein [Roseateles albus]